MSHQGSPGMMGIGTLIIFIAVIIVAAVAAGVLITTSGSLQQKALTTGNQAEDDVTSGLRVLQVVGLDGSDGFLESYEIKIRLASGSETIKFSNLVITMDTVNCSDEFEYAGLSSNSSNSSSNSTNTTGYTLAYLKRGKYYNPGYLSMGDMIRVDFSASCVVGESETVRIQFVPEVGLISEVEFITPDALVTQRAFLYP